jgi:hypothetical protein
MLYLAMQLSHECDMKALLFFVLEALLKTMAIGDTHRWHDIDIEVEYPVAVRKKPVARSPRDRRKGPGWAKSMAGGGGDSMTDWNAKFLIDVCGFE